MVGCVGKSKLVSHNLVAKQMQQKSFQDATLTTLVENPQFLLTTHNVGLITGSTSQEKTGL